MRLISIAALAFLMAGCVSTKDYIGDYREKFREHPQARVDCSGFLDKSAEAKVSGAITTNKDKNTGKATAQSSIRGLKDDQGSIYQACVEAWEIRNAGQWANKVAHAVNECIFVMSFLIITAPFVPLCYSIDSSSMWIKWTN